MCYSVASTSKHIHAVVIHRTRGKQNNNKKEIKTTSVSHTILWLSDCSNRKKMSATQEVTCTYLHHTTPLFFLSPTLLSFQGQATHGPRRGHEAAAEHCHLPDTGGQQKPASWVRWQRSRLDLRAPTVTGLPLGWFSN